MNSGLGGYFRVINVMQAFSGETDRPTPVSVKTWLGVAARLAELDGYREYARTTRYRLLPGVW
jgi:hypothetical protein